MTTRGYDPKKFRDYGWMKDHAVYIVSPGNDDRKHLGMAVRDAAQFDGDRQAEVQVLSGKLDAICYMQKHGVKRIEGAHFKTDWGTRAKKYRFLTLGACPAYQGTKHLFICPTILKDLPAGRVKPKPVTDGEAFARGFFPNRQKLIIHYEGLPDEEQLRKDYELEASVFHLDRTLPEDGSAPDPTQITSFVQAFIKKQKEKERLSWEEYQEILAGTE